MRVLINILKFVCTFLVSIFILEVFLSYSKIGQKYLTEISKDNERYFRKNMQDFFYKESFGIIKTNEEGIIEYKPKSGIVKKNINLYGDGFLESMQVFPRLHFGQALADKKDYFIRNFGISGLDIYTIAQRIKKTQDENPSDLNIIFLSIKDFKYYPYDPYFPKVKIEENELVLSKSPENKDLKVKLIPYFTHSTLLNSINLIRRDFNSKWLYNKFIQHPAKIKPKYPTTTNAYFKYNKKEVNTILRELKKHNILVVYIAGTGNESEIVKNFKELQIPLLNLEEKYREENIKPKDLYYFPSTKTSGHWNLFAHKKLEKWISEKLDELNY